MWRQLQFAVTTNNHDFLIDMLQCYNINRFSNYLFRRQEYLNDQNSSCKFIKHGGSVRFYFKTLLLRLYVNNFANFSSVVHK